MLEANVLDKYHAPTDGRHFFGTKNVDCPMLQVLIHPKAGTS